MQGTTETPSSTPPAAFMLPGVNLFASGIYRGKKWTAATVQRMAANAKKLGPSGMQLLVPPAAPGHEDDDGWQQFVGDVDAPGRPAADRTDQPAAGWVDPDSVRAVPDPKHKGHLILRGDVVNIPAAMAEKIRSGEYSFGSAEVYDDFHDDLGIGFGKALRKFSFLGAEVPQVKRLGRLPKPVPMSAPKQFSERAGVFIVERRVRKEGLTYTYAETAVMDRQQMTAAVMAAMPGLSQATLDALSDEQLADLVKNIPAPATPDPMAAAAPAAPAMPFAEGDEDEDEEPADEPAEGEMSREEMVSALVEMGEDEAELEAMEDDEIGALYDEMTAEPEPEEEAPEEVATMVGQEPVYDMADPMTAPREELIAELVAMGQDAAQLEAMPEEELRALAAQLLGAGDPAAAAAPAMAPAAGPALMSERRKKGKKHSMSERYKRQAVALFAETESALASLRASNFAAKRQDAEAFCERLVEAGRATPALVKVALLPDLLRLDNTRRIHSFTDGGAKRTVSAYELKKLALAKLPIIFTMGERFPRDGKPDAGTEVAKVRQYAETMPETALKACGYKTREQFVETFAELNKKDPTYTAAKLIGK